MPTDRKVTDDTALTGASLADGDLFDVVDISDTTDDATGTNKKMTALETAIGISSRLVSVALSKLASQATATILGNNSGSTGSPTALTAAQTMALLSGGASSDFSMNSHKIQSVTDPASAQDAATKNYVDTNSGLSIASFAHKNVTAGRYYSPIFSGSVTGKSFGDGDAGYVPFDVGDTHTWVGMGINVTAATAGQTMRLGIFADNAGRPGTLVIDAGTVSAASTGNVELTMSQSLTAGRYWLCGAKQGGGGAASFTIMAQTIAWASAGGTLANALAGQNGVGGFTSSGITGAFASNPAVSYEGDKPLVIAMKA